MKHVLIVAALCLPSAVWAGCDLPSAALPLTAVDHAQMVGFVTLETPVVSAPFDLMVHLCDPATMIRFDATMPAHKHGMNYQPVVTEAGVGSFVVENVVFHMPGLWELQVTPEGHDDHYRAELRVE